MPPMNALPADAMNDHHSERRRFILAFEGHWEQRGATVVAICDHAPLITHGADEDEALARMERAGELYLRTLLGRGELDIALVQGKVRVRLSEISGGDVLSARVEKQDHAFRAELATV